MRLSALIALAWLVAPTGAFAESADIPLTAKSLQDFSCTETFEFRVQGLNVANGGLLNVRSGPGKDYPSKGQIREGDVIGGCIGPGEWVMIVAGPGAGSWVSPRYLVARNEVNAQPQVPIVKDDGMVVDISPNGTATVAERAGDYLKSWKLKCERDAMTDERICSMATDIGGPFIFYGSSSRPESVCILGHDFPGRTGMIRIDRNPPFETNEQGCAKAKELISQMENGASFVSRRYDWPYDYPKDDGFSLAAYRKAVEVMAHLQASQF